MKVGKRVYLKLGVSGERQWPATGRAERNV